MGAKECAQEQSILVGDSREFGVVLASPVTTSQRQPPTCSRICQQCSTDVSTTGTLANIYYILPLEHHFDQIALLSNLNAYVETHV